MSTHESGETGSDDASRVFTAYFDYLKQVDVTTFDPKRHDTLFENYLRIVRQQTRNGIKKNGYLDRFRKDMARYTRTFPRIAGVLSALLFILICQQTVLGGEGLNAFSRAGVLPDDWFNRLLRASGIAFVLGFGSMFLLAGSRWSLRSFGVGLRERMKDIRLLNFGQIVKEIAAAKQSALDNATTDKPEEGPVNLLRLVMLSRLHFELVRALEIDYDIFKDGVKRTDLRNENEKMRLGLVAATLLVLATFALVNVQTTLAPAATGLSPMVGTVVVWSLVAGTVAVGFLARASLYVIYHPLVLGAIDEQKMLFLPQMNGEHLMRLRIAPARAREFNWDHKTDTKELLSYVQWLEDEFQDINERLKGQVVVRRNEGSTERKALLPAMDRTRD